MGQEFGHGLAWRCLWLKVSYEVVVKLLPGWVGGGNTLLPVGLSTWLPYDMAFRFPPNEQIQRVRVPRKEPQPFYNLVLEMTSITLPYYVFKKWVIMCSTLKVGRGLHKSVIARRQGDWDGMRWNRMKNQETEPHIHGYLM